MPRETNGDVDELPQIDFEVKISEELTLVIEKEITLDYLNEESTLKFSTPT